MALPDWVALIEQWPGATSVTVLPETVQTGKVVDAKLTGRPDDAVAATVKGGAPYVLADNGLKVIHFGKRA